MRDFMGEADFSFFRYRLPLRWPVVAGRVGKRDLVREGVLVLCRVENGTEGWGEIAPLDGYCPDTLAEGVRELGEGRAMTSVLPSVRCGLTFARAEASARQDGVSLAEWLGARRGGAGEVEVSRLWREGEHGTRKTEDGTRNTENGRRNTEHGSGETGDGRRDAGDGKRNTENGTRKTEEGRGKTEDGRRDAENGRRETEDGRRETEEGRWKTEEEKRKTEEGRGETEEGDPGVVKLKVGRLPVLEEVARVGMAMARFPGAMFRLDANGAWSLEEALAFAQAVPPERVAFIEEPLRDAAGYEQFDAASPVGYALDESLVRQAPVFRPGLKALVIKPMALGGLRVALDLIALAYRHGRYAVVSSVFESGVGVRQLAALAAARTPGVPAGLDTYAWLDDDVASPRVVMKDGFMKLDEPWTVDRSRLERLA